MIYDLSDGQTPGSAEKIRGDRDPAETGGSQNIGRTMMQNWKFDSRRLQAETKLFVFQKRF